MKIIKTIFITLVLMSFFILSKVNAETCTLGNEYTNELASVLNNQFSANIGNNAWTVNFNSPIQLNGSDMQYIKFYLHYEIRQTNNTIYNINMASICSPTYNYSGTENYTITYADGTQANITGEDREAICIDWTSSGGANYNYQPNINMVHLVIIRDDDRYIPCDVDTNGIAKCPIEGNHSYKAFRYYITLSEGTNIPISIGIITRNVPKCSNDNQAIINNNNQNQEQTHQDMQNINNSLNNNNVSGANQDANSFVNNQAFQDNTGLTGIITAPLSVINSLTSSCSPIRLTIPYLDTNVDLPCIGDLLASKMGALIQLVKVVINGYICYLIGLDMFKIVKHARDPDDDRIEVLDL